MVKADFPALHALLKVITNEGFVAVRKQVVSLDAGSRGTRAMTKACSIVILALLLTQPAAAATYPITISYGRSWPLWVVVDSARGLAYVDATSGEYPPTGFSLGVINATSHSLIRTVPLDVFPGPMALDQATGSVFVAGNSSIEVFGAGGANGEVKALGFQIFDIAFDARVSPDIFLTSGGKVFAVDPHTLEVAGNATVANGPYGLVLDPSNGMLYVSEYLAPEIAVLNASTLDQVTTVRLSSCCASHLALDSKAQMLYATTGTNLVDVVNAATEQFVRSVQVAPSSSNSTNSIAVDNGTGRVYVATSPGGGIVELDGPAGGAVRHLQAEYQVAGLALDEETQELYATNYHQITVFDASRQRTLLIAIGVGVALVAVAAIAVYLIVRRRDERDRVRMQSVTPAGAAWR